MVSRRKRRKKVFQRVIDDKEEQSDPEEPEFPLCYDDDLKDGSDPNGEEHARSDGTSRSASASVTVVPKSSENTTRL